MAAVLARVAGPQILKRELPMLINQYLPLMLDNADTLPFDDTMTKIINSIKQNYPEKLPVFKSCWDKMNTAVQREIPSESEAEPEAESSWFGGKRHKKRTRRMRRNRK